nr:MAG TPA: hypothetical protein [Caudoviricetes sp.]
MRSCCSGVRLLMSSDLTLALLERIFDRSGQRLTST